MDCGQPVVPDEETEGEKVALPTKKVAAWFAILRGCALFFVSCLGLFLFLCLTPGRVRAGVIFFNSTPTGVLTVPSQSYAELKFRDVVRQRFDFSCGSAAVATLLTYEYLRPTTETAAFQYMYKTGDKKKIQKHGFSLLDIKRYLSSLGYKSDGYRLSLDKLMELRLPAIVLIEVNGYKHFVVVKGISNQNVLIGDPAMGLRMDSRKHFLTLWKNGIVFVIHEEELELLLVFVLLVLLLFPLFEPGAAWTASGKDRKATAVRTANVFFISMAVTPHCER